MMYLTFIKKAPTYDKFKMEQIPVEITSEEGKVKSITSNKPILVNEDIFEEISNFIKNKELEENEVIQVEEMFYITFTSCSENSDKLFYAGRKLKEILERDAQRQIQDLKDLVKSIELSKGRFA